jgi:pyroglutamyl-peptidase
MTRLPVDVMVDSIRASGVPCAPSLSAGAYLCNAVMYLSLHLMRRRRNRPVGFIHLPYTTAQAAHHPGAPGMASDAMEQAIAIALRVALARRGVKRMRRAAHRSIFCCGSGKASDATSQD